MRSIKESARNELGDKRRGIRFFVRRCGVLIYRVPNAYIRLGEMMAWIVVAVALFLGGCTGWAVAKFLAVTFGWWGWGG